MTIEINNNNVSVSSLRYDIRPDQIEFGLASGPKKNRELLLLAHSCRDYINDYLRMCYVPGKDCAADSDDGLNAEFDKFRLLLFINKDSKGKKRLFHAKRIINIYESIAKMDPGVIATVNMNGGSNRQIVQFCGDKKWVSYSQLASMVTLIFRVVYQSGGAENISTIEDVDNYWKKYIATDQPYCLDYEYIRNASGLFRPLMENFDKIFTLSAVEAHTMSDEKVSWHCFGGINSLSLCSTKVTDLDKKIEELKKTLTPGDKSETKQPGPGQVR